MTTDAEYLRAAIDLARRHMEAGHGGPFGAVIVHEGRVVAEGWNQVTSTPDPTAHAEIVAIRQAAGRLGRFSLAGGTLYTSCEPCPMCLTAILWARIDRMVYACDRDDAARAGFDDSWFYAQVALPIDGRALPAKRLLPAEGNAAFKAWIDNPAKTPY